MVDGDNIALTDVEAQQVVQLFKHDVSSVIDLDVDGKVITTTDTTIRVTDY